MKVAISTDGNNVSPHFGRCPGFTLADISNGRITARTYIGNPGHEPGFLPQFLREKGVDCIIAGGMGQRAQSLFSEKNIRTVMGVSGKVDDVLDLFRSGKLTGGESLCDHGSGEGHGHGEGCDHHNHHH